MARPRHPLQVQRSFWQQVRSGCEVEQAAATVGVSRPVAWRWNAECGGVIPSFATTQLIPASAGGRLSIDERHHIAVARVLGASIRAIAAMVGRSPSTISHELDRNSNAAGQYHAAAAQDRADRRAQAKGRAASPAKLATNLRLRREVQTRLCQRHSPEQIVARLRRDFPDDPEMRVSHETIYQSLFVQGRGGLKRELTQHLRTGRSLRKPRRQLQARHARQTRPLGWLHDALMISDRPPEVADRALPGHWEGDLIMGKLSKSAIATLVEKATGFTVLVHLPDGHDALAVQHAMVQAFQAMPGLLRKTLTWDQGSEMANHAKIAADTGLDIYFCDPHSPWQRPSNENTNGLLRQYFPKGTDLSLWGPGILETVAIELNNRPRKRLDWDTPAEALDRLLSQHDNPPGVALAP